MTGKGAGSGTGGAAARKPRGMRVARSGCLSAASVLTTFLTPGSMLWLVARRQESRRNLGEFKTNNTVFLNHAIPTQSDSRSDRFPLPVTGVQRSDFHLKSFRGPVSWATDKALCPPPACLALRPFGLLAGWESSCL